MQHTNTLWGLCVAGVWKHTARVGSQVKLEIVTLSSAEPSPENNPLRCVALSFILFVWNALVCCVWAFFCRTTRSTEEQRKSHQPRLLTKVRHILPPANVDLSHIHLISSSQLNDERPFCSASTIRSRIWQVSVYCRERNNKVIVWSGGCLITLILHPTWCGYSCYRRKENWDTVAAQKHQQRRVCGKTSVLLNHSEESRPWG